MRIQIRILCALMWLSSLAFANANKLSFQGFGGGYLSIGKMDKGFRTFTLKVDQDPWHFEAKGMVNAAGQTADLDILKDEIVVVVAYFDQGYTDASGKPQSTGFSDVLFFIEDEPGKVKDVSFTLLPPVVSDPKATKLFAEAQAMFKQYQATMSADARASAEDGLITSASADPWIKDVKEKEIKAREADAQKTLQKARQDSIAKAESDRKALERKTAATSSTTVKSKSNADSEDPELSQALDSEDDGVPVKKKKKKKKKSKKVKKKKKVVEDEVDLDAEEAAEANVTEEDPTEDETKGFMSKKSNRKKMGIGLLGVGGVTALYGIYEHMEFSKRLTALQELDTQYPGIAGNAVWRYTPSLHGGYPGLTYHDIENEKIGAEDRRNIALVLGVLLIGGGVVIINF